ncbi:MAG: hypothetical protein WCE79_24180 [Xanthobacteraceae bacterium]
MEEWMVGFGVAWGVLTPVFVMMTASIVASMVAPGSDFKITPAIEILMGAVMWSPAVAGIGCILFGVGWLAPHGWWRGETLLLMPFAAILAAVLFAKSASIGPIVAVAVAGGLFLLGRHVDLINGLFAAFATLTAIGIAASAVTLIADGIDAHREAKALAEAQAAEAAANAPSALTCMLVFDGAEAASFERVVDLPPELDPENGPHGERREDFAEPGALTLRAGASILRIGVPHHKAFLEWCRGYAATPGAEPIRLRICYHGTLRDEIVLKDAYASQAEIELMLGGAQTKVRRMVIVHGGWKRAAVE